jgi:hypothetical protein
MNKPTSRILSASSMTLLALLFVIISGQLVFTRQGNASALMVIPVLNPGAPLKGVDVKLGRNPGGQAAARTTTDDRGHFTLPAVPAGSYSLTLSFPEDAAGSATAKTKHDMQKSAIQNIKAREANPALTDLKACLITIEGAVGGTRTTGWNFETSKAFNPNKAATAKTTAAEEKILVDSNGKDPLSGTVEATVIKSKSNITNN